MKLALTPSKVLLSWYVHACKVLTIISGFLDQGGLLVACISWISLLYDMLPRSINHQALSQNIHVVDVLDIKLILLGKAN